MSPSKTRLLAVLGGVLCIGGALGVGRYRREIGAARAALDRRGSRVAATACGPVEYAVAGTGDPVLVVHGAMGGFDQGLMLADAFVASGYQAIAVSRFGYLRSPLPENATLDMQADAYACLLDTLGIRRAAIFATSGGATSAIRFAVRHPQRTAALVLLSPAAPGAVKAATPPRMLFDVLLRSDFVYWALLAVFRPAMRGMVGVPQGFALTPPQQTEVDETLATTLPVSGRMDGMVFDMYAISPDFYAEIDDESPYAARRVMAPVLVLHALDDPLALAGNVRGLAEKFPDVRLFSVPDGGHLLLGHRARVNAAIVQFLNDVMAVPRDNATTQDSG